MSLSRTRREVLAAGAGAAQPARRANSPIEALVRDEARAGRFCGAVAVARADRTLLHAGFGPADREWDLPCASDTRFRIGSLTKSVTAALILRLEAQGRLRLSDLLGVRWRDAPQAWREVSLHQLLTHTAGLPNLQADAGFDVWSKLPAAPGQMALRMAARTLDFTPGSQTRYSNTGYVVLGLVAEQAVQRPFADLLRTEVFAPLGMSSTRVDDGRALIPRRARGYQREGDAIVAAGYIDMGVPGAAGDLVSTTEDLLAFVRGVYAGRLLDPARVALMTGRADGAAPFGQMPDRDRPAVYAYGLRRADSPLGPEVFHSGSINGYRGYLRHFERPGLTVIALSNASWADVEGLTRRLAQLA